MGVYFDYFRAADDDAARETHTLFGGPLHAPPDGEQPFDGVATKAVFPDPHLPQLLALARGVPYERGQRAEVGLWPPPSTPPPVDENSLWLIDPAVGRLATWLRDGLADIGPERAHELGPAWAPLLDDRCPVDVAASLAVDLGALARRAQEAGQELYYFSE